MRADRVLGVPEISGRDKRSKSLHVTPKGMQKNHYIKAGELSLQHTTSNITLSQSYQQNRLTIPRTFFQQ